MTRGSETQTYDYNALGALKTNDTTVLDDQRPKLGGGGNASAAVPATYNNLPVTLDAGGRVTSLQGETLLYSRRGALAAITKVNGGTTDAEYYGHDASGRRIATAKASTTGGVTTWAPQEMYEWTGANVTGQLDVVKLGNTSTPTVTVSKTWLFEGVDRPLRLKVGGLKYFYELDLAGNVRRLRRPDGSDAGGYRYSAFGTQYAGPAPAVDQPLRWKGRWWSDFGGIYDVRARQWSPALGAFTSEDEFVFHDARSTLWGWPGQSPIRWQDPSGHDPAWADPVGFSDVGPPSHDEQVGAALGLGALGLVALPAPLKAALGILFGLGSTLGSDDAARQTEIGPKSTAGGLVWTAAMMAPIADVGGLTSVEPRVCDAGTYLAGKAPRQVTPGTRVLEGQYVNDLGRVEPWRAHYDDYGRLVGRTDFNAENVAHGIPETHHHVYDWSTRGGAGQEIVKHAPGEYVP